jgi:hypothetical protein
VTRLARFWLFVALAAVSLHAQSAGLNHFYIVLDSQSYDAIERDPFLRGEFAPSETRTTVRTDTTYSGLYFYGRTTYWEFFSPGSRAGVSVGDAGIAFGTDERGALDRLLPKLDPALKTERREITREWNGKQWPWFLELRTAIPAGSPFQTWAMEYNRTFLANWRPSTSKPNEGIARAKILERYADVLPKHPDQPWLRDVEAITIALNPQDAQRLRQFARGLGFQASEMEVVTPEARITIQQETPAARGIRQFRVRLQRKPEKERELRLGRVRVVLRTNGTADWTF